MTVPARGAAWMCSIFIASSVTTGCPVLTRCPGATSTATTRPFIDARSLPSAEPAPFGFTLAARVVSSTSRGVPRQLKHSRTPSRR